VASIKAITSEFLVDDVMALNTYTVAGRSRELLINQSQKIIRDLNGRNHEMLLITVKFHKIFKTTMPNECRLKQPKHFRKNHQRSLKHTFFRGQMGF